MTTTNKHAEFQRIMKDHYAAERNRSEACLGDILNIICDEDMTIADQVEKITGRLVQHYSRA